MKKTVLSFAIILLATVLILLIGASFVASSSAVAHAAYAQAAVAAETGTSVSVIKAPVSNLKDNEFAGISTLKIIVNDADAFYIPESYFVIFKMNVPNSEMKMVQYSYDYSKTPRLRDFFVASGEKSDLLLSGGADEESETRKLFPDVTLYLKDDVSEATVGNRLITSDYTLKLLGFSADGSQVYVDAVYNGELAASGFIAKADLKAFNVPYQERSQAERDAILAAQNQPDPTKGDLIPPDNTSVALRVVIIIGITIPALLIAFFLFKPTKGEQAYAKKTVRSRRRKDEYDYDNPRSYRDRRQARDDDESNPRDDDYERSRRSRDDDYDRDRRSSRDEDYDRDRRSSRDDRYDDRNGRDRRDRYDDRDNRRDYDDRR